MQGLGVGNGGMEGVGSSMLHLLGTTHRGRTCSVSTVKLHVQHAVLLGQSLKQGAKVD